MRGLIYKEFFVFCKSVDKKRMLFILGMIVLLIYNVGFYGGVLASLMLAMVIGMQNIISFASDDTAHWKKYQMALPVSDFSVVASKYICVIFTLGISLLGSVIFNLLTSIIYNKFDFALWKVAAVAAIIIPLIWTGVCLPLIYWFGLQSAQTMSLFMIIPIFYLIKHFEDEVGFSAMTGSMKTYLFFAGIAILVYAVSILISVLGYARKK